jgi:serine/threonine-protein kinase
MLEPSQRIGEYILDEPIGRSAYAQVWRAHHHMWDEQIAAVKIPTDPAYIANLRGEGVRVQRLVHPNIVRPVGFDPHADPPYLMTEFVPGGSLRPWLAEKKLSVPQAASILRQILAALEFGHGKGIVHGDIKPENILLEASADKNDFADPGSVKVTDFGVGLAAMATLTGDSAAKAQPHIGTMAYVAPEQRDGTPPDVRSDIYSVGVILFEMLTGERPTGAELPSEINPAVPKTLDDLFRKSYARRDRRFASATEMLAALQPEPRVSPPAITTWAAPPGSNIFPPAAPAQSPVAPAQSPVAPAQSPVAPAQSPVAPAQSPIAAPVLPIAREIDLSRKPESPAREKPAIRPAAAEDNSSDDLISFKDDDDRASESAEPVMSPPEDIPLDTEPAIDFQEKESERSRHAAEPDEQPEPAGEISPFAEEPPTPGLEETARLDEADLGDTPAQGEEFDADEAIEETAPAQTGPTIPTIPRVPSRADRDAMFDELSKKQLRSPDDLQVVFKPFVDLMKMDEGESANIRIRIRKWANATAGGQTEVDANLSVGSAINRPLYQLFLITRPASPTPKPDVITPHVTQRVTDHAEITAALRDTDYRLIAHVSAARIRQRFIDVFPNELLKQFLTEMSRLARAAAGLNVVRQDLLIFRANVIDTSYKFDNAEFPAYLVGNSLAIIAPREPFSRIREEPTKRAAAMFDAGDVRGGIKELYRALDNPRFVEKGGTMLGALRGKLATAYMKAAQAHFAEFGWLESLDISAKAGRLAPGSDEALEHAGKVAKRARQLHLFPGLALSIVFIGLSLLFTLDTTQDFKTNFSRIIINGFFIGGIAALIATLISTAQVAVRMGKTELSFFHAMLLPLCVGGVFALGISLRPKFENHNIEILVSAGICIVALTAVIVADTMVFKYFRKYLYRQTGETQLAGDELSVLGEIERMLDSDWEMLQPHFEKLGPLFTFAGARIALPSDTAAYTPQPMEAMPANAAAETALDESPAAPAPRAAAATASTGNSEVDKLAAQMQSRIAASGRALVPPVRLIITLTDEYSKSVTNRQLGMMQSHANKIVQKGKELLAKLADFERLCKSPLTIDGANDSPQIRQLAEDMASKTQGGDYLLYKRLADSAIAFGADQTAGLDKLRQLTAEAQLTLDRLKRG